MMIECFYYNSRFTYYLLLHTYVLDDIPSLIPLPTISNIAISVNKSNVVLPFLNKLAMIIQVQTKIEQSQFHIFLKLLNTSGSNNV